MQTLSNKSKVRRCLFGPPDHDSLRKDLDKAMEDSNEEFISKYNFDFKNDVPLEGKFQWEVVNDGYIPDFYKKSYPVKVKRSERRISDLNVKMTSGNLSSLSFDRLGTDKSDSEPNNTNCENSESSSLGSSQCNIPPHKLVQTQISAFMPKRKRSRSEVTSSVRAKAPRL